MIDANMTKRVKLSVIKEDLYNGLTKWKKDDIGFGSLEKKYSLTLSEMVELTANPKVKAMETRIPTFVIEDDLPEEEVERTTTITVAAPVLETKIEQPEVQAPKLEAKVEVKKVEVSYQEEEIIVPFL